MALSELQLIIFGDSHSDGGYRGYGIGAEGGSHDPMEEVYCGPMRKITEDVGSKYYFKELGYYECCASDGPTWPYHVGVKKVLNFACSGGTSCQYVEKYVEVPPGYVAMPASECLVGHRYHPRGVAQQIQWAAKILPQEIWSDTKTWVIIGTLGNDVIYHREKAIGSTISEVSRCPYVQNHRQMLEDLRDLGVSSDRVLSAGLPCFDLLPGTSDMDPDWFRTQQEEVHKCLDAMLKQPRWRLSELWRDLWNDRVPSVKKHCVWEALQSFSREDLPALKLRSTGDATKFQLFDEFHPNSATHQAMGMNLAELLTELLEEKLKGS